MKHDETLPLFTSVYIVELLVNLPGCSMNVENLYAFPPAERGRCSPNLGGKNPSMEHFYTPYRLYLTRFSSRLFGAWFWIPRSV